MELHIQAGFLKYFVYSEESELLESLRHQFPNATIIPFGGMIQISAVGKNAPAWYTVCNFLKSLGYTLL